MCHKSAIGVGIAIRIQHRTVRGGVNHMYWIFCFKRYYVQASTSSFSMNMGLLKGFTATCTILVTMPAASHGVRGTYFPLPVAVTLVPDLCQEIHDFIQFFIRFSITGSIVVQCHCRIELREWVMQIRNDFVSFSILHALW